MSHQHIPYIDEYQPEKNTILVRLDLNVSLKANHTIADDARIQQSIPTIKYLLERKNKLILVSHLGRPKGRDKEYSLKPVAKRLAEYLPGYTIKLVDDFLSEDPNTFEKQKSKEIILLENIRYYPEEKLNETAFAKKLADLADMYVNDAFGVSHRADASVVGITHHLPSYGGLLLKKEIEMISKATDHPEPPIVAILGGAKISSKIHLVERLMTIADYLVIGGGMANTFLAAQGYNVGKSMAEYEQIEVAKKILHKAKRVKTQIVLPLDAVVSTSLENTGGAVCKIDNVPKEAYILDIGPESQALIGSIIAKAKTVIWNGPVGYFENPVFRRGTDFLYYAITNNTEAISVVGGGDTLAAISKKEYLDNITHISTGGGAMLEFIEKGKLPGIDALTKRSV